MEKNPPSYKCPKCEGSNFKRWALPHPMILHWILNPGLAINEIVLGQRVPKTQLICTDCEGPVIDRAYVPCPSCCTMHLGRHASGKNSFRNWRGVACPTCKEPIPCIWNLFSLLILLLTFPLWAIPYFCHFRKQPLRPLFQSDNAEPPTPKPLTKKTWFIMGAAWGGFMWVFMTGIAVLTGIGGESGWKTALITLPIWILGGFAFGFCMWFFLGRSPKK